MWSHLGLPLLSYDKRQRCSKWEVGWVQWRRLPLVWRLTQGNSYAIGGQKGCPTETGVRGAARVDGREGNLVLQTLCLLHPGWPLLLGIKAALEGGILFKSFLFISTSGFPRAWGARIPVGHAYKRVLPFVWKWVYGESPTWERPMVWKPTLGKTPSGDQL